MTPEVRQLVRIAARIAYRRMKERALAAQKLPEPVKHAYSAPVSGDQTMTDRTPART